MDFVHCEVCFGNQKEAIGLENDEFDRVFMKYKCSDCDHISKELLVLPREQRFSHSRRMILLNDIN